MTDGKVVHPLNKKQYRYRVEWGSGDRQDNANSQFPAMRNIVIQQAPLQYDLELNTEATKPFLHAIRFSDEDWWRLETITGAYWTKGLDGKRFFHESFQTFSSEEMVMTRRPFRSKTQWTRPARFVVSEDDGVIFLHLLTAEEWHELDTRSN